MTTETDSWFVRRHLRFGWCSLVVFLLIGIVLEGLHGLKVGWYLNTSNEVRRLLWTLAHAHGTLFGLIHVGAALTARLLPPASASWQRLASPCLIAASLLLPGGFLLGGIWIYDGDPGLGVLLVPIGAVALVVGTVLTARAAWLGTR